MLSHIALNQNIAASTNSAVIKMSIHFKNKKGDHKASNNSIVLPKYIPNDTISQFKRLLMLIHHMDLFLNLY